MLVQGASSAVSIGAGVISLGALCWRPAGAPYGYARPDHLGLAFCIALCSPVAAVALSTLAHGHPLLRTWDSPSRFLLEAFNPDELAGDHTTPRGSGAK